MMKKRAFTLTETLIMVAVIGIIAVISVVSLKGMKPDKEVVMLRKAYADISKAVAALINDQNLYPYANIVMKNNLMNFFQSFSAVLSTGATGCNTIGGSEYCYLDNICLPINASGSTCNSGEIPKTGHQCNSDCSYGCIDGYVAAIDENGAYICVDPGSPDASSLLLSTGDNTGLDFTASEILTSSGTPSTTNLSEGTYSDSSGGGTAGSSSSGGDSAVASALNPHGTIFLNTAPTNGATKYTSANKFAYNFGRLFKNKDLACNNNVCTFTTTDGMSWSVQDNFNNSSLKNAIITVDVNGSSVGNNTSNSNQPDIFKFKVDAGGGISIYSANTNDKKAQNFAIDVLKNRKTKK